MYWDDLKDFHPSTELLDNLESCIQADRDWKSTAAAALAAKELLYSELFNAQQHRCGYCRRLIHQNSRGARELDHILPKNASTTQTHITSNLREHRKQTSGYPEFTFNRWNLILTCDSCNQKKGSYDARRDRSAPNPNSPYYNLDPGFFEWVHPYLHRFSEHINIRENVVYEIANGSSNGEAVIAACRLDKISAAEKATREVKLQKEENVFRVIGELMCNVELIGRDLFIDEVCESFPNIDREEIEDMCKKMGV